MNDNWIFVEKRLPKRGEKVLVLGKSGWMEVMSLDISSGNGYWYPGGCPIANTVCWITLPEKPIVENEWDQ